MTQAGIHHVTHPLHRWYRTDNMTLWHHHLHKTFYLDTLFSRIKSIHGHKCAQVMTDGHFTHVFPMTTKANVGEALTHFVQEVGIPDMVVIDNAGKQTGDNMEFVKTCQLYKIQQRQTEPYTPKQNWAESAIRELKKWWCNKMAIKRVPKHLWDYGPTWASEINNWTARGPNA